jgi:hypothetical protein
MKEQEQPYGKLEQGLIQAMQAIDGQVARAMQRTPAQEAVLGVQKWEPYNTRVESIAAFLLQEIGDGNLQLDSLLVCSQAFAKALQLLCSDLGAEGLGKLRSAYCLEAMQKISRDAERVVDALSDQQLV